MRKLYLGLLMILSLGAAVFACACGDDSGSTGNKGNQNCQHTYSEWQYVEGKEATCTTGGQQERTCSKCGNKDVRDVDPLGHSYAKEKTTVRESTCKEPGIYGYKCIRCDDVKDGEELELKEHTYGEYFVDIPATCTKSGVEKRVCEVCKNEDKRPIKASGHNFDDPNPTTVDATCEKDGSITRHCQNEGCEEVQKLTLRHAGHKWVDDKGTRKEPSCTEPGSVHQTCSECKATRTAKIPSPGHQYKRVIDEPNTCTADGKATDTCSECGDVQHVTLKAMGHSFETIYRVDKLPEDGKEGSQSQHCIHEGCKVTQNVKPLTKDSKLRYYVNVVRDNGATAPKTFGIEIFDSDGKSVKNTSGNSFYADLPIGNYTVKLSGVPSGYSVAKTTFELTPFQLDCNFVLKTQINKEDNSLQYTYGEGSVLRNHTLDIIELSEKDNYTTSIVELLKTYKAIFINTFFVNCNPCMSEIQHMLDVYYTETPRGTIYGEEVAFIMLTSSGLETEDSVRAFKSSPKTYSTYMTDDVLLPFMMSIQDDFVTYLNPLGHFPTSFVIDSEGVINYVEEGPILTPESFINLFENRALKFYYDSQAKAEQPAQSSLTYVPEAILPDRKH